MKYYKFQFDQETQTLVIGFGEPAQNDLILNEIKETAPDIIGVKLLKINGPASLPVAMFLAHKYCHTVGAIAVFDPKLGKYVVCISHTPEYSVGQLVD